MKFAMKKYIFGTILAIVFGVGGAFLFVKFDDFKWAQDSSNKHKFDENLSCNLNGNACFSADVKFSTTPNLIEAMRPFTLQISNLKGEFDDLNARIYGLNMDMGTILVRLNKIDEIYEGKAVISVCVVKEMVYRVELYDGKKPLGIYVDLKIK